MGANSGVLHTTVSTRGDKLHFGGGHQAKRIHRVDSLCPTSGQCISPLKLSSTSRKRGEDKEEANDAKDLTQMRQNNLKFDILKFLKYQLVSVSMLS